MLFWFKEFRWLFYLNAGKLSGLGILSVVITAKWWFLNVNHSYQTEYEKKSRGIVTASRMAEWNCSGDFIWRRRLSYQILMISFQFFATKGPRSKRRILTLMK